VGKTVRLTVVRNEGEAEILCRLLRTEGIGCAFRDSDLAAGGADGGRSFGGWREILIDHDDLERARELVAADELEVECVECGRPIGDDGRWYPDATDELMPYCAGCAEREFGPPG
jgi:putative signal transducing protein